MKKQLLSFVLLASTCALSAYPELVKDITPAELQVCFVKRVHNGEDRQEVKNSFIKRIQELLDAGEITPDRAVELVASLENC
ncbi:MAG: hypothetical protein WC707_06515 [Candidatus Babeliaceae bacterium]|jgi:hypothetical protein